MKTAYPDYLWIGATNARGQIVVATDSATVGLDYSAQPWFQAVRNGRAAYVWLSGSIAVYGSRASRIGSHLSLIRSVGPRLPKTCTRSRINGFAGSEGSVKV